MVEGWGGRGGLLVWGGDVAVGEDIFGGRADGEGGSSGEGVW